MSGLRPEQAEDRRIWQGSTRYRQSGNNDMHSESNTDLAARIDLAHVPIRPSYEKIDEVPFKVDACFNQRKFNLSRLSNWIQHKISRVNIHASHMVMPSGFMSQL